VVVVEAAASAAGGGEEMGVVVPPPPSTTTTTTTTAAATAQTSLHLDFTGTRSRTLSVHHLYRVTDRSTLAAKTIVDTGSLGSMAAAGYRLRFRNAAAAVTGEADTYGNVRLLLEREPLKDVKLAFSAELKLLGEGGSNTFGAQLSVGQQPALPRLLSPITITRDIFGAY
jgi:hypothetical protein